MITVLGEHVISLVYRPSGPSHCADDSCPGDNCDCLWSVHGVRLVLTHASSTPASDGKGRVGVVHVGLS